MRAFLIIFVYYLVVVARARPAYIQAVARAARSTNILEIARRTAGPWAVRFVQAAARAFGPPPERVMEIARGDTSERRPVLRPAEPEPRQNSNAGGGSLSDAVPDIAGLIGTAIGGPVAGGALSGILGGLGLGTTGEPDPNRGTCHLEIGGGPFDARDQEKYGADSVPSTNIGHLRVGRCTAEGRQSCIALEPNAIRMGDDYLVAKYPGRLAHEMANKFRSSGRMSPRGQRALASAYINTLNAVQMVPRDFRRFVDELGYRPPELECDRLPPHLTDATSTIDAWYFQGGANPDAIGWLQRQRLLLFQAGEFLSRIMVELDESRPLPEDVRLAVARNNFELRGDFSLSTTRRDPPRIVINRSQADDFLPPE